MAAELKHIDPGYTGSTLYAVLLNSAGAVWNGAAFETLEADNWATYDIALTESDGLGVFLGDMPAVAAGVYSVLVYDRAGATPATSDEQIGLGSLDWSGTAERTLLTAAQVNAEVVDALQTDTPVDGKSIVAALQITAAGVAGLVSGAGTAEETFKGLDQLTTRLVVTADSAGNRTAVEYP